MMSMFRNSYRIVYDDYLGFEVQVRRWWFPFWMQAGFCNTHKSQEQARRWAEMHAQKTVEYLGSFKP